MNNYYSILEVTKIATNKEIKIAYRKLAMEWHPDKNKNVNAHSKFLEINEAYEILTDPIKRKEYDNISKSGQGEVISDEFKKWRNNAKSKAESYAEMDFDKYKSKVIDELKLAVHYMPAFGCFIVLIIGVIVNLWAITIIGLMGLLSAIVFGGGALYIYNVSIKYYLNDRNNLNN